MNESPRRWFFPGHVETQLLFETALDMNDRPTPVPLLVSHLLFYLPNGGQVSSAAISTTLN